MNNPIETYSFKHYLNFKSLGFALPYRIIEPDGFDAENFVIKQNDERFSRDVIYGNEEEDLMFKEGIGERGDGQQVVHPDGTVSEYLDSGLNWILETIRLFGWEGVIERILEVDGVQFTTGILDLPEPDSDGFTYFGCKVIQNANVSNYKKQLDTTIDVFSTQDIKGNPITPAPTLNVLRRAVPITGMSQWSKTRTSFTAYTSFFFCLNTQIITDGVKSTLASTSEVLRKFAGGWREMTFAQHEAGGFDWTDSTEGRSMKLLKAIRQLTAISVNVKFKGTLQPQFSGVSTSFYYFVMVSSEDQFLENFNAGNFIKIFDFPYNGDEDSYTLDVDQTMILPVNVPIGQFLYGGYSLNGTPLGEFAERETIVLAQDSLVTISASELSLDTVIGSVRYIDVAKQCSKFINNTPVDAAIFDVGGEHHNNVCYNRSLLSAKTSNSLELINDVTPEGNAVGQVVYNTNGTITGTLPVGLYFWNGTQWISLASDTITNIELTSSSDPAGSAIGALAFNTNQDVSPVGLCYWNGTDWASLQIQKPMVTSIQDCFESAMTIETCSDYEIKEDKILFAEFPKYYTNTEIGVFLMEPAKTFKKGWNDKFKLNNIKFAFDTYETNRMTKNSANDIHTEAEWNVPNEAAENKFERSIKYVRSGFSAQAMVDLETNEPQTADETDDDVFIAKITPLADGSFNEFEATLFISVVDGLLQILNRTSDGDEDNVVINWNTLGFSPGDDFYVTIAGVTKHYLIDSFTNSLLKLDPVGFTATGNGDTSLSLKYFYTNVQWQTATDQDYSLIEGLENPTRTPNLDYTLRRIFSRWEQYFKSSGLFHAGLSIRNLFYKNNPPLKSQKTGDALYVEKGAIPFSGMPDPILGPNVYDIEVFADYFQILLLLQAYEADHGFVRCYDLQKVVKGYIQELDYTWKTGSLKLKIEEKFEPDIITLVYADDQLTVNDTPYDLQGNVDWYEITSGFFRCFDSESRPICSRTPYQRVQFNGEIYPSADELLIAITGAMPI